MYPQPNVFSLPAEDEAAIREHHATDSGGFERCVICRLLATIDYERAFKVPPGMVAVRIGTGGVLADGTTNHVPPTFQLEPNATTVGMDD
jgi:hypothetical protein